jgi:hypothetical protein
MSAKKLKLKASKRAFEILANQAIGNDLLKGLIELVTNSDDSYARLAERANVVDGRVEIEIDRRPRKNQTLLRVIDYAEGMDHSQMEQCVGGYGEDTSGQAGRGIFGMGLKDTINAFGDGVITSFKHDQKFQCELTDFENLKIEEPRKVSRNDKVNFRNSAGGTDVQVLVTNPKVTIPLIDTVRQSLQTHVCLRSIMTDKNRKVTLRDVRHGTVDELRYEVPDGVVLVKDLVLELPTFPDLKPTLTVLEATGGSLTQAGSYRTGGILVTTRRSCHEATLFGFDEDPDAANLFGELRCDAIYDLQAGGEQIVDKNRNGLRKDHPITRELYEAGKKFVEHLLSEKKDEAKRKQKALEDAETAQRFRSAVKTLNDIANSELQLGGAGAGLGAGSSIHRDINLPTDGFEFMPDEYRVLLAERSNLKLRILVDGSTGISVGDPIEVSCDNSHIKILNDFPTVPSLSSDEPPISVVSIQIEGTQANAQGFVTAKCGHKAAIAVVEVVSSRAQKEHPPRGGLFKEIKYEEQPEIPQRARFDRKEGTIWINTTGPSVNLYFGRDGEGQEQPANQTLVAELVTELACREITRLKDSMRTLDIPPGIERTEAFFQYVDKLKAEYAPNLHRALVNPGYRRPLAKTKASSRT